MLPTGLTYSSFAKRSIPFTANCTCGVGRRVLRSCSKPVERRDVEILSRTAEGMLVTPRNVAVPGSTNLDLIEMSRSHSCRPQVHVPVFPLLLLKTSG